LFWCSGFGKVGFGVAALMRLVFGAMASVMLFFGAMASVMLFFGAMALARLVFGATVSAKLVFGATALAKLFIGAMALVFAVGLAWLVFDCCSIVWLGGWFLLQRGSCYGGVNMKKMKTIYLLELLWNSGCSSPCCHHWLIIVFIPLTPVINVLAWANLEQC